MAVTLSTVAERRHEGGGTFGSLESLTQSTATAAQSVSLVHDVTTLGAGTATGFGVNTYELATGAVEGREKLVQMGATGEAKLSVGGGTATGQLVFQADGDMVLMRYLNNTWLVDKTVGATLATAT